MPAVNKRLRRCHLLGLLLLPLALSCAPVAYRARPIAPSATAAALAQRRLTAPGLERFLEANKAHVRGWPPATWDLNRLVLAAWYFNPVMAVARAQAQVADAAVITAGARPNPTVTLAPGIPGPYLFDLSFSVPLETAGRRADRIVQARALSTAARLQIGETAWQVRSAVRTALLDYLLAVRRRALLDAEAHVQARLATRLAGRVAAGEDARPIADAARVALLTQQVAVGAADEQVAAGRAAVAAAIGVPAVALRHLTLTWPDLGRPPAAGDVAPRVIQRDAVLNRLDVRRRLAEYAAADAALRLEIARQYPDVHLGPGYQFEEGHNYFTVGLSISLPIFNRNQGPIAEAAARRRAAAARLLATQAHVIAESETALARYRAARAELRQAQTALDEIQQVTEPAARQAVAVGETDRLPLDRLSLQALQARLVRLGALTRVEMALGQLENAVQCPLERGHTVESPGAPPGPRRQETP